MFHLSFHNFFRGEDEASTLIPLPLVLDPITAESVLHTVEVAELHNLYPPKPFSSTTTSSSVSFGNPPFAAPASVSSIFDAEFHAETPFLVEMDNRHQQLRPSGPVARLHKDEMFELSYRLCVSALQAAVQRADQRSKFQQSSLLRSTARGRQPEGVLSSLVLQLIRNASEESAETFLKTFDDMISCQGPFSIDLSPSDEVYYTAVAEMCERFFKSSRHPRQSPSSSTSSSPYTFSSSSLGLQTPAKDRHLVSPVPPVTPNTTREINNAQQKRAAENLVRFWLGQGSMQHSLTCVNFLLRQCKGRDGTFEHLPLGDFIAQWQHYLAMARRSVVRVGWERHFTEVGALAGKVFILPVLKEARLRAVTKTAQGRRWEIEDEDSGSTTFEKCGDNTSKILEEAYQAGMQFVEFSGGEGKGLMYRVDFTRMVQRDLQTGKERHLRYLLALLIKERGGREIMVEINMPHDTKIRDLRVELSKYLKYDETRLRMMYTNRVLLRADFQDLSIRNAIIPLGTEPLVSKLIFVIYRNLLFYFFCLLSGAYKDAS